MKKILTLSALLALLVTHPSADAGLFTLFRADCGADKNCGADKSKGDCGADKAGCKSDGCGPDCTKTVTKPCDPQVFNYQRKESTSPGPCGANACVPNCAAPEAAPAGGPADPNCAAPESGGAPACAPAAACGSSAGCGATACCNGGCSKDDACAIAELIFASQTECYAKDRARAIDRLGDNYSCVCHPEIMAAFVYSLNDTDERVRAEAADEIGDQARKNGCGCANERTVEALTMALGDCDLNVRRQASEALQVCGYCIEDNCAPAKAACGTSCAPACGADGAKCGADGAKCGASGTCAPDGKCGANGTCAPGAKCGASGTCAPACGATGTAAPAANGEGGGEAGLSPSAVDSTETPAETKEAPAPPKEEPAKPDYDEKAKPAAPPKADDKTAGQLKKRSVLSRLFGIIRR